MAELISSSLKELKAALKETEKAANRIISAAESMQKDTAKLADKKLIEKINKSLIKIYENSDFHDLTGQRISKVIKNLEEIKTKTGNINPSKKSASQALMEGPQLKIVRQSDIDKLFESL